MLRDFQRQMFQPQTVGQARQWQTADKVIKNFYVFATFQPAIVPRLLLAFRCFHLDIRHI